MQNPHASPLTSPHPYCRGGHHMDSTVVSFGPIRNPPACLGCSW